MNGLAFDPVTGTLFGSRNNNDLITINRTTGAVTTLGPTVAGIDAIVFAGVPPLVTPTLSEWAMILMGLLIAAAGLLALRRRG